MLRYQKYNYLTKNFQLSKSKVYDLSNIVTIKNVTVQAGHFKPTSTFVEHGLLVTNITGQIPVTNLFKHGKRLRNTVTIKNNVQTKWKWAVLDKFLNTFLPAIGDLKAYKTKNSKISTYSWRIRNFFEWADADSLLSDRITKKDVFLPLFIDVYLTKVKSQKQNEDLLRMIRIPADLFKNK